MQASGSEWLQIFKASIVLLNFADTEVPADQNSIYTSVIGDACDLSRCGDGEFELVHSNLVIEHVGRGEDRRAMASESARVDKAYCHQTRYFWVPLDLHFMCPFRHWLPMSLRVKIAQRWALGTWPKARSVDEAVRFQSNSILLNTRMMASLFLDSSLEFEHLFGLPKSLIA